MALADLIVLAMNISNWEPGSTPPLRHRCSSHSAQDRRQSVSSISCLQPLRCSRSPRRCPRAKNARATIQLTSTSVAPTPAPELAERRGTTTRQFIKPGAPEGDGPGLLCATSGHSHSVGILRRGKWSHRAYSPIIASCNRSMVTTPSSGTRKDCSVIS